MAAEGLRNEPSVSDAPVVPSTERVALTPSMPAAWLERLFEASLSVRPNLPLEESAGILLDAARELLDDVAFGVCIPRGDRERLVVRRAPMRDAAGDDDASDPSKLFPRLAFEHVIPIHAQQGSTLHVACDDEERFTGGTPGQVFVDRLAAALGAAIDNARSLDRGQTDLRAQIIQSEKLASLGQIAAGIVHELNNPLTTIVAYSDYLRKKAERSQGDPADIERLARINEAAERILRFSRDLTAYSRPASETPAPVLIHDIIDRALVFCEHELGKTGVSVERNFGDVRMVRGVAGQLTQVFVNLFTNAAHAMRDQGGLLSVTTAMVGDEVAVTITDDGHGIDTVHLPRIFDPFFTTKTDGTGTGLGLSIVRSIVVSHGGHIRADGHFPHGTVFHVSLPIAGR